MPNLNKVMLMGNITRDPEVRFTPKGTAVTDLSLAVNRTYTTDDGKPREETTFVEVTYWGRQAEVIGEYMKKGRPIYVEGRLQLDTWEDKTTGQNRSRLKIIGEGFQFLGSRDDGGGGSRGHSSPSESRSSSRPEPSGSTPNAGSSDGYDRIEEEDDIPF
jgi:single-strand DNA-binding protein